MLRETFAGIFCEFLARHRLASIAVAAHQSAVNRWCQGRLELADLLGDVFRPVMAPYEGSASLACDLLMERTAGCLTVLAGNPVEAVAFPE